MQLCNHTIMQSIRRMEAKHIMVVADSCFSGSLIRGIKITDRNPDYLKKIVE